MQIVEIRDTREKMEVDDGNGDTRMVGIPGTGIRRPCDACGRVHEIHVHVQDGDKSLVVGLGCAKKDARIHAALLLHEIRCIVQEIGIPQIVVPTDFLDRLNPAGKGMVFAASYSLDGQSHVRHAMKTKVQKLLLNQVDNRGRAIRKLLWPSA